MSNIKLFQNQEIRSVWDTAQEQWLFSVIDIIQALTGNARPRKYWQYLKTKLVHEGSELSDKIGQLKMRAGQVAGNARREIEAKTGKKVVTELNAKQLGKMKSGMAKSVGRPK